MRLFAISDLHLSLGVEKPMDVFGEQWRDHHLKIKENWEKVVSPEDVVILGGDFSWAMKLEEAREDFAFLNNLPGQKVLLKGNHDYWWQSYAQVKTALPASIHALQNNYYHFNDRIALCGTRGWSIPGEGRSSQEDEKVYKRELLRLEMSLKSARQDGYEDCIVTLHYPPFSNRGLKSGFVEIMQSYEVKICLYGHLHGDDHAKAAEGEIEGITYYFTACDYLSFRPRLIDLSVFNAPI